MMIKSGVTQCPKCKKENCKYEIHEEDYDEKRVQQYYWEKCECGHTERKSAVHFKDEADYWDAYPDGQSDIEIHG